ncbi:MAG: DUF5716 family protein [Peptococcaceae bacterium]|nr:DUF5716 family protein [Peptococcaceae bacterium]
MRLFEAVHPELFTVLASPNRELYANALEVIYEAYHDYLKIPENTLYTMLRGRMERQLADASFEGEDIDEDELRDISGRARFLMRKLCSRGWFEKERGKDFEEYIIVPGYSSKLLELFHQLTHEETLRGYSYVFGTYSSLKVAQEGDSAYDKMMAVYNAYDNTQELIRLLKTVYHNVRRYIQIQIEMRDVNQVLATHFDEFGQQVVESYIRPLKIKDSVPKYRVPIRNILDEWLEDDGTLLAMSSAALQDKRKDSLDGCRKDLLEKIFWVKEQYEHIETDYLEEIDQQVRRYTRATTQKIENLTNHDQNTRGNLNYLLSALAGTRRAGDLLDVIQPAFQLFGQAYFSEKSMWFRKRPVKHEKTAPIIVEEESVSEAAKAEAARLIDARFGKAEVAAYMERLFEQADMLYLKDLQVDDDFEYVMSLLAVINSSDPDSFYRAEVLDGDFSRNRYRMPQIRFIRKRRG